MGTIFIDHNAAHKILRMFFYFVLQYNTGNGEIKSGNRKNPIIYASGQGKDADSNSSVAWLIPW